MYQPANFQSYEFECSCGCGGGMAEMDEEFLKKLDRLRDHLGEAIHLNSAYRCPEYNASISSTGTSGPHTTGKAVDIRASGEYTHRLLQAIYKVGFAGIGINQKGDWSGRFIHLDDLNSSEYDGPRPWVWSYG